ncbi:MAG: DUF6732 family protein [Marinosulfonomonas sp.]
MRLTILLALFATPAAAHPGHLTGLDHDHWLAGIAIGAAIAAGLWGLLKGDPKDKTEEESDEEEIDAEPEAA